MLADTRRCLFAALALTLSSTCLHAQGDGASTAPPVPANPAQAYAPPSDIEMVERLNAARRDYQTVLEKLRAHYIKVGDVERARWAEEELVGFHRLGKRAYRLELDVPPPSLQAAYNIPAANELYMRAMSYKDRGWGQDYADNQRRSELLFQQILTSYPQCDKIDDAAYQLGEIYESRTYKQYRRAASYYERCVQWNPNTQFDARLKAARLYDKYLSERQKAIQLYRDILTHETDPKAIAEAQKRLADLAGSVK